MKDTPKSEKLLTVDVSKAELMCFDGQKNWPIPNETAHIQALLKAHKGWLVVCEPTSSYHVELVNLAYANNHPVCLVNPKEVKSYRECRSFRAKTDPIDAVAIYEFASRHRDALRLWQPAPKVLQRLRQLMGFRMALVKSRARLSQSFGKEDWKGVKDSLDARIEEFDKEIEEIASSFEDYKILRGMPGVGPVCAPALVYILNVHQFVHQDAPVAFVGIDPRVKDSGTFKGKRKITKRGDPLLRHLCTMAGFGLLNTKFAKNQKAELAHRGHHRTAQGVIAARKILRVAFHLHQTKTQFDPTKWSWMA
jgi:transposase